MRIRFSTLLFRRIHKWVGLIVGLQFVLWTLSGSMMALLDADAVGGHEGPAMHAMPVTTKAVIDPFRATGGRPVIRLALRDLAGRPVYEVVDSKGTRVVDAITGATVRIDGEVATVIGSQLSNSPVLRTTFLAAPNLEAREHKEPVWRLDFDDALHSSAYISATTGRHLVTRNDTWRVWDFFWMLHNMDYRERASFNHPLIIMVAAIVLWLSGTGIFLLFKSFRSADFRWLRKRPKAPASVPVDSGTAA